MYNEDEVLFCRTFTSVIKVRLSIPSQPPATKADDLFSPHLQNIQHLQSRTKSKTWGDGSWKKCDVPRAIFFRTMLNELPRRIVVCVVSDGRTKINPRTLKILGLYGAYQDGIAKDTVGVF
jgi:chitin synthase